LNFTENYCTFIKICFKIQTFKLIQSRQMKKHHAAISLTLATALVAPMGYSLAQTTTVPSAVKSIVPTATPAKVKPVTATTTAPAAVKSTVPATTTAVIKAGTVFTGKLTKKISSGNAHNNDKFTLKVSTPLFGGNPLLKGAIIEGHVEDVVKAQRGKKASLHLVFDDIIFKNKQGQFIDATLVNTKLEKQTQGTLLRNVAILTAGAVAGHYLGQKAGLPTGTGVTSAAAFVLTSPGGEVVINKGTDFKLKLNKDLVVKNAMVKK
jgi:hypothetical protein